MVRLRLGYTKSESHAYEPELVMAELREVLEKYLQEAPRRSLNGLSKRCTVSEPTLRRILRGQIKTLPQISTVLDVLTTVSGEKNSRKLAEIFPGQIAKYLNETAPHMAETNADYDPALNLELKNPTAYLIYKMASNRQGVSREKVSELFGAQGLFNLESMTKKGFVVEKDDRYFGSSRNFTGSYEDFLNNFKSVANFIKTKDFDNKANLNPVLVNYSESISEEAYREVVNIQKAAHKKIRAILADENSKGPIPAFLLVALDTLDHKTAGEIASQPQS
jgi:hypothetical protein